jgi:hypothetical protein
MLQPVQATIADGDKQVGLNGFTFVESGAIIPKLEENVLDDILGVFHAVDEGICIIAQTHIQTGKKLFKATFVTLINALHESAIVSLRWYNLLTFVKHKAFPGY